MARGARPDQNETTKDEAREALSQLDPLWDKPFPAEQARIAQLLVEVEAAGGGPRRGVP